MSKYHAIRTEVDGVSFASKAEARRYSELRLLVKAQEISGLTLQPRYPLVVTTPAGVPIKVGDYVGDFHYVQNGRIVIEDVKGYDLPLSKWKRKHTEAQYGVSIVVVR